MFMTNRMLYQVWEEIYNHIDIDTTRGQGNWWLFQERGNINISLKKNMNTCVVPLVKQRNKNK